MRVANVGDKVHVVDGPLKGRVGTLVKIDEFGTPNHLVQFADGMQRRYG